MNESSGFLTFHLIGREAGAFLRPIGSSKSMTRTSARGLHILYPELKTEYPGSPLSPGLTRHPQPH